MSEQVTTTILPNTTVSSVPRELVLKAADHLANIGGPEHPTFSGLVRAGLASLAGMPPDDVLRFAEPKRRTETVMDSIREASCNREEVSA